MTVTFHPPLDATHPASVNTLLGGKSFVLAGIEPLTLLDFPGHLAAIGFTQGCNFRCTYCHNASLIPFHPSSSCNPAIKQPPPIVLETFLTWLTLRQHVLTGVVISGGEATLQPGLIHALAAIKAMGFSVKLDTNGSQPKVLQYVLEHNLVDYVALDIKLPPQRYHTFSGSTQTAQFVAESLQLLRQESIPYECRTTVAHPLHRPADVLAIAEWVSGVPRYVLQNFCSPPKETMLAGCEQLSPYPLQELEALQQTIAPLVGECLIR